ncbi:replicative DNA helicase [Pasteurella multocida]|uniref:replicative DNA helicase n=1 Tax=Pasteurella multocida TaxID=747 RepID=UPI00147F7E8F|nr:replicative DNA helicase [Pasteurella multocida]NNI27797.1 replicative DNA helicase [Pasteurella multocida]NNI28892.1 replicative DNA helicase [Pasteurella multocida]NNI58095.1 replicative DNA helicase [Pasteurella multocida]
MSHKQPIELYSVDAESSVLGGLILDNSLFDEIVDVIIPNDFYLHAHQIIFKGISSLLSNAKPVDILTLEQYFKEQGILEQLGGLAYIAQLVKITPTTANFKAYIDIVVLYSKHRKLLRLGQNIISEIQVAKSAEKLDELLENIERQFTDLTLSQQTDGVIDLNETLKKVVLRMESSAQNADPVTGTPTGIQELDEVTTGGQAGDFIVIGARPSMGKTAFCQTIAYHTLEKFKDLPIQFYSMEMPAEQILQRFLAMRARVSLQAIRKADQLGEDEWAKISLAMGHILDEWKNRLLIDDEGGLTPQKLRSKVRYNIRKYGKPAAIFIDYLQLMQGSRRYENRHLEITAISQALKNLAKEVDCPVYALSQLNRSLEQRANKRPMNADLRESGSLEQDADLILFIYRDEVYNEQTEHPGTAEIIIGKQRNGPLKTVFTRFIGEYSLFENLAVTQY